MYPRLVPPVCLFLIGAFAPITSHAQTLVSQVNWGSPQTSAPSCPFQVSPTFVTDAKSWPTYGSYECPNGPSSNTDAWPNPLVAYGDLACVLGVRTCEPLFSDPVRGVDGQGPFASVTATERGLSGLACVNGPAEYAKSHTYNIYSNSHICVCNPCSPGYVQDCGDAGWHSQDQCGCYQCVLTPIIVSVAGGARPSLSGASEGVLFDAWGSGRRQLIAWPEPADAAAWLVLDRNGNGVIDNGTELFGNSTRLADGSRAANGYIALSELDSNQDGQVDSADPGYTQVQGWIDSNRNGLTEAGELRTLAEIGLAGISTVARESRERDRWGNVYRLRSESIWTTPPVRRFSYDVFLLAGRHP